MKEVEAELARLKCMYADLALEHHALEDVLSRKAVQPDLSYGVLDRYVFTTRYGARRMTGDWRHHYNRQRPRRPLGGPSLVAHAGASSTTSISG